MSGTVFIGCGAGFAGDRSDAAVPVVETLKTCDGPRYLMFETLAERTLALSQIERRRDPAKGYSPALERMIAPVLRACMENKIRIVGNFGAANPRAGAGRILEIAKSQNLPAPKIAVVEGDDLTSALPAAEFSRREIDGMLLAKADEIISANIYLGARPIADALDQGADIVVTGRVADSALALGPLMHAHRWKDTDLDCLAAGTLAGHLLECGAQITGGYFADPGIKDVSSLAEVGYPIAEINSSGEIIIGKARGTGGRVDRFTVIEQTLYEIHDPAAYLAPDVVLDLSEVEVEEIGPHRVKVTGARGKPAPATLKATVCVDGGLLGEAEISYAGPNALNRARLAAEIIRERMQRREPSLKFRVDAIGSLSVLGNSDGTDWPDTGNDIRLRFAAQSEDVAKIELLLNEVEALYCAGPAGGAGVRRRTTPRLVSASCLIEREYAKPRVTMLGGGA